MVRWNNLKEETKVAIFAVPIFFVVVPAIYLISFKDTGKAHPFCGQDYIQEFGEAKCMESREQVLERQMEYHERKGRY